MTLPLPIHTLVRQRYLIQQVIGQGGFARTYLAIDQERFQEHCVIKEFVVAYQDETLIRKSKRLFQRESNILHQISHSQIPKFLAAFEEEGRLFLVQDYVAGPTYRALQQQRRAQGIQFTEAEILHLLAYLLPVLDYLHQLKIIHRDISPDNIILQNCSIDAESHHNSSPPTPGRSLCASNNANSTTCITGRDHSSVPVLIDFGAVKEATSGLTLVSSMTRVGKVGYAPPEQLQTGNVQPHSDLYALAATCLVLLTGREPDTLLDSQTLSWRWDPHIQLSPALGSILRKMLALHPGERYGTAYEVWEALKPVLPETTLTATTSIWQQHSEPRSAVSYSADTIDRNALENNRLKENSRLAFLPTIQERGLQTWQFWQTLSPPKALGLALLATVTIGASIFRQPATPSANFLSHSHETHPAHPANTDLAPDDGKPHEIQFQTNEMSKVVRGDLLGNRYKIHTLKASRGQIMTADLKGTGVFMNIMRGNEQRPLENSSYQTHNWTGTLPADDEYQIHVTGSGAYSLEVSITPLNRAVPLETQTIDFPKGKSGTTVTGQLKAQQLQRYFVKAKNNKMMVISDTQGNVNVSILNPKGQQIGGTSSTSRSWQGRVPIDGSYVLEVKADREDTNFALSLEIY